MSIPDINQLLHADRIQIGMNVSTKKEAINALIDSLDGHPSIDELSEVRNAIFKRENTMSTGVGKGLGLPHAKTSAVSETVAAFATATPPVPFDAIDDQPVELILLLVGPENDASLHIKVLGRISRLVNRGSIRKALTAASTPEAVMNTLQDAEAALRR
ncbi:MAG: PTS sugar transporter subunit IIA [Longimonas sp.]|uniref:PTS sugar transporter subunit IIA n=1 Tax=Longimonas sp. TaxID=2039626 RepID=UPI00335F2B36